VSFVKGSLVSGSPNVSPAEDEEAAGDAEMMAYVNRRKARRASGGSKKDDLADITEFPEDIEPATPISQRCELGHDGESIWLTRFSVHHKEPRPDVRL
jgi:dual specificity tyrosine-phosphorylation-regulated kinase 2/3/4